MKRANTRYRQDEHGVWWYHGSSSRTRANVHKCPACEEEFVSCERSPKFCGHSCAATARHAKQISTTDKRYTRFTNSDNPLFARDDNGQWWYAPKGAPRTRAYIQTCAECGNRFLANIFHRKKQGTCSKSCGIRAFHRTHPKRFAREKSGRWKGGRQVRNGYVYLLAPEHPAFKGTKRIYMAEHRLVMESHLGRLLTEHERVHHKNGIRDDNRIENLELCVMGSDRSHPPGQRVHEQQHCPTCSCFK